MFVIGNISPQESNSKLIKRKEEDFEASERLTEVAAKRVRKGEVRVSLDLDHIEKLIDQIDRLEDFPSDDLPEVLDLIEAYRSDPDKSPFFLPKDSSVSLGEIELTFPFSLGLRPVEKEERSGIVVLFEPSCEKLEKNEEAIDWNLAFEMFIPDQLFPDQKLSLDQVRIAYEKEEMRKETKKELRMRSRVEQIPGGGELFQPAPYLYSKKPFIFTSPLSGEALSSKKDSLSSFDGLKICRDIAMQIHCLSQACLINSMVSDRFIVCQKKEGTRARALLDRMSETSSPHRRDWEISSQELNSLAKRGYISFETDRYGLILLIADFFLSQKAPFKALSVDPIEQKQRWEAHLLQKLQEEVSPSFYEKVVSLKEIHGGFLGDFSKDLLAYIETHYEEASNYRALKKFALNSAVFPWIADLLWNTLKADEAHQRWIEEKGSSLAGEDPLIILSQAPSISTIEEIVTVLDAAEQKITELSAHTVSQEVSLLQSQQIIEFLFPEEEELFKLETATTFHEKISEALNSESFKERGEVRLHKEKMNLPFSLWVQKETQKVEGIVVSILGQPLGDGEFKKVKGLTQFFVPVNSSFPISVSFAALLRIRQGGVKESERGDLIQRETFRRVPLAHDYFVPPAKRHLSHEGAFTQKLEWEAPWYSGDLNTFIKAMASPSQIEGEKESLRWIDLIRCLKHVTSGVTLLEEAAIFHRDLSSANIFIKKQEDSSWTAHIADFDLAKDMSGLKNELMSEEEFFERKSDRYSLVTLILGALTEKMGVYFPGLELETLDEKIAECRFRVFKKRESFFQKLGMDPTLEDRALLAIAKDRPYAQTVEIKRFVATMCFFDQVVGLFEKAHRSALRMEDLEKEYLREGLSYHQAQQRSFIDTSFPSFEEIEAVLSSCESIAQDYDF